MTATNAKNLFENLISAKDQKRSQNYSVNDPAKIVQALPLCTYISIDRKSTSKISFLVNFVKLLHLEKFAFEVSVN